MTMTATTLDLETGSTLAESTYIESSSKKDSQNHSDFKNADVSSKYLTKLRQSDIISMKHHGISSPFFPHRRLPLIYCDHTASSRALHSIENFINKKILPLYANTHTTTSVTGSQCTAWLAESRQIVAEACNARITGKASTDVVLFTGNGATGAIELALNLAVSSWQARCESEFTHDGKKRIVVYIGPLEHHSNMLPFRELKNRFKNINSIDVEIHNVPPSSATNGSVDIRAFEEMILRHANISAGNSNDTIDNSLKIGCFSAASNVTGLISEISTITALLKKHNILSFIDYATAAPYMPIDMNPANTGAPIDAAFISTHKILGGINTPGILIIKKSLIDRTIPPPSRIGGGTVFYTTESDILYTTNWVERNEGGTPNIIGCIRSGLSFLTRKKLLAANYWNEYKELKEVLGVESNDTKAMDESYLGLMKYECMAHSLCLSYLKRHAENLVVLGDDTTSHRNLPIFSFLIRCGDKFLHYNLVCAILNDVFGIQSRGGCQCAGPYSQRLLGLSYVTKDNSFHSNAMNDKIRETLISEKAELLRPGFTRLSLNFMMSAKEIQYVLSSILWICKNGYKLCGHGLYTMNAKSGEWRHHTRQSKPLGNERIWLTQIDEANEGVNEVMNENDLLLSSQAADEVLNSLTVPKPLAAAELYNDLRWFVTPSDCIKLMSNGLRSTSSIDQNSFYLIPCPTNQRNSSVSSDLDIMNNKLYSFRDGEFSGVARLEEITEGFESGELSDECIIFINDEWKSITALSLPLSVDNNQIMSHIVDTVITATDNIPANASETISSDSLPINVVKDDSFESCQKMEKVTRSKPIIPPKKLMRNIQKAVLEHDMILEGDILLLGLSGGKDSLSMLHVLIYLQKKLRQHFELKVLTVDPGSSGYDPSSLIEYLANLRDGYGKEIEYHYVKENIMSRAYNNNFGGDETKRVTSICAYCARMKRGVMYATMRKCNANKLVLAQHLDDAAESTMMSLFHNGFLRTMKANYTINMGDLSVIRPFIYTRESELTKFAVESNLPIINENCPACFEEPKERARMKKLLAREEGLFSNLYDNMRKAILPLMHADSSSLMWSYTSQITDKSKKENKKGKVEKSSRQDQIERDINKCTDHNLENVETQTTIDLSMLSEDDLVTELARRRAKKFSFKGSLQKDITSPSENLKSDVNSDEAPICTLNGGPGSVPCYELME